MAASKHSLDASSMNKSSIKFASWALRASFAHKHTYTYVAKRTGHEVTAHKLELRLVGTSPTAYVLGAFKGTEQEVERAATQFTNGSIWEVSNIKFDELSTPPFISSAIKVCVHLKKSTTRLLSDPDLAKQLATDAVPPRTVTEASNITSSRHQDLLAIITEIDPCRNTKRGKAMDCVVMDASADSAGDYGKIRVTVWGKTNQKLLSVGKPLVFFNLACKVENDSKQFNLWENSLLCEAPECDKRVQITKEFPKIKDATNSVMLTKFVPKTAMDVSGPQSIGAGAFLDYTSQNPHANLPDVLQIMAATIEEPSGSVTPEGADRIWFVTKFREFSGAAEASMPERVALQLTGLDRAGFMEAHRDGTLQFPLLCNMRVSRSISTQSGASQPDVAKDTKKFVNHVIQDARAIDWNNSIAPNAAYEGVLTVLNQWPGNEEGLPFALSLIHI